MRRTFRSSLFAFLIALLLIATVVNADLIPYIFTACLLSCAVEQFRREVGGSELILFVVSFRSPQLLVILFISRLSLGVAPPIQKSGKSGKPGTPLSTLALFLDERVGDFFEAAEDDVAVAGAVSMDMSRIEQQYNPGCKSFFGSGTVESSMLVTTDGPIDRPCEVIRARSLSISSSSIAALFIVVVMSAMVIMVRSPALFVMVAAAAG